MTNHEIVQEDTTYINEDWLATADPTDPMTMLVQALKNRMEDPKYPIDFTVFDMVPEDELDQLVSKENLDPVMQENLVKYLDSQTQSYKEGQQIQIVILDRYNNRGLCGCLGPGNWAYCPCAMDRNIFQNRYSLYKYYKERSLAT